jgi:uncharacterized membrane protein
MEAVSAAVFEFLFKYRPVVFERGQLIFGMPWPAYVIIPLGLILIATPLLGYARVQGRIRTPDRVVLASLRFLAMLIILFCLAQPILVLATVVPQENFLGILIDDSRSMRVADDGRPRSAFILEKFGQEGSELLAGLDERFKLRFFSFSDVATRISGVQDLTFNGSYTKLGSALQWAQTELSAVPLAGLVVFSDGADNSADPLTESLLQLKGRGIPVHTVGLGQERFDKDIELARVESPREVLHGSSVAADVMVVHSGYGGATVTLNVEDAGRIVATQDVELPREGEIATVRVHFTVAESGPRLFRFHILPQPEELVSENNTREILVVVRDRREKVLYFEGEPRFELGKLRRAVEEDDNLHVVALVRTAENKYWGGGVEHEEELAGGFPKTREELFQYRALILGSIEASFFTHDQLQMIAEFVGQRGGGLLMLGGRNSFAEGGYAGTPVASVLPVVLEPADVTGSAPIFREVKVELTPFGRSHPIAQIAASPEESSKRWPELPEVSSLNMVTETKPGASTLLTGSADDHDDLIVLAVQRYGRGRALAFTVQDSWLWQMHADVPLDDMTYETFWQQVLRWLVSSTPDQVAVTLPEDRVGVAEEVAITAEVVDSTYLRVNDSQVSASVTAPSGEVQVLPLEWVVERDGEYGSRYAPTEQGLYEIRVDATKGEAPVGEATTYLQVADPVDEYFGAQMRSPLLKRLADETGGRFYTPETVGSLPEDVRYTESGSTVYEERDLWDMPIVFLMLIGLMATEWGYRRARGLV